MNFKTKSGKSIEARPLTAYDAPLLVDLFEHMSAESRYRRFHQTLDNPNSSEVWEEAERIAQMGDDEQRGLIAFWQRPLRPNVPVAVARYVKLDDDRAEMAMSVRDDMQGQGIGTWLLEQTAVLARQEGLQKLVGSALNENEAIWYVLGKLPFPYTRTPDGAISEIELDLSVLKDANSPLNDSA